MTEEQILNQALSLSIDANKALQQKKSDIGFHYLYSESVDMAERISYHAVKGKFPEKIFQYRSPNQTDKEAKYIKDNYKQQTLPVFMDYLSTITRPFGDGNWSIAYNEDESVFKTADKTFQKYVESEMPIYGSLENFVKFILPSIKSIDANGFLAVRPKDVDYVENENGEAVIDSESLYKPTVYYFNSQSVVNYAIGEYYLFLSKEKSIVKFNGKPQRSGSIFELYTKEAVYFISQIGVKTDNLFEVSEYYRHNAGECFTHQLMGVPNLSGDEILWQSPFLYSTDLLDLVAMNANWLQASINKCVYPHVVMFGDNCEFTDAEGNHCDSGIIHANGEKKTCQSCNGSGLKSRLSPVGTLLVKPTTKFEPGEERSTQDPLKFISPEVHTLEFISTKIEQDENKARKMLYLKPRTTATNKTAEEVRYDDKAMQAFIKPISDQIFSLYEFCLNAIGAQRYGEQFVAPELSYPKTFDFKSPEDYLQIVTNAISTNLPPSFIQVILMQYINAFYGDSSKSTVIFKIIMSADRLFGLSNDEINMQLARGTIAKWEQILHTSILGFINESIDNDTDFLSKETAKQVEILKDLAIEKEEEISTIQESTFPIA